MFNAPLAPQIHLSSHHHSHLDNVTAPTGRPNFKSRLHFSHSWGWGRPRSVRGHVVALGEKYYHYFNKFVNCNWVNTRWQWYSTHNQYI